MDEEDTIQIEA